MAVSVLLIIGEATGNTTQLEHHQRQSSDCFTLASRWMLFGVIIKA